MAGRRVIDIGAISSFLFTIVPATFVVVLHGIEDRGQCKFFFGIRPVDGIGRNMLTEISWIQCWSV
jgi:hypothetical protein